MFLVHFGFDYDLSLEVKYGIFHLCIILVLKKF
jgi:hypothetical protein